MSNPQAPLIVRNVDTKGQAFDVEISNGIAYVAHVAGGLQVVDVSDPMTAVTVGGIDLGSSTGLATNGEHVYVADGSAGVEIAPVQCPVTASVEGAFSDAYTRVIGSPNPFVGSTSIRFALERSSRVEIELHDVQGRRTRVLDAGTMSPGMYAISWDGIDENGRVAPAGVYFVRVRTEGAVLAGQLIRTSPR